ncbi:hypothetical protein EWM64_g3371 [Hericium alpestre]|uniref:Uncharacterized protein n=1 Tax=Hericium alpestre TaxID=135208 RepID=A0A4Z0A4N3_9AGAM|nr:hypothetical protein EWM64_g3371 [Hericium alpestre]
MLFNDSDEYSGYPNAISALPALSTQVQGQIKSEDIVAPRPIHYTAFVQAPGLEANNNTIAPGRLLPSDFPAFPYPGSAPGLAFPVPGSFPFPYQHASAVTHNIAGEQAPFRHPPPPVAFLCRFEDVSALARRLRSTYYANTERAIQHKKEPLPSDQGECENVPYDSTFPKADDEDKENLPPATIEQSGPDDSINNNVIAAIAAAAPLPAHPTTASDAPGAERRPAQPNSPDAADAPAPVPEVADGIES